LKREPAQFLPARDLTRSPDPRRDAVAVFKLPLASLLPVASLLLACSSSSSAPAGAGLSTQVSSGEASLKAGNWQGALDSCVAGEKAHPDDCNATYCEFIARTMMVVDEINSFLLPRYRRPLAAMPGDVQNLSTTNMLLAAAEQSAETTIGKQCQIDLPVLPLLIGDKADPVVSGEVRGLWTVRDAQLIAALLYSITYGLQAEFSPQPVSLPADGGAPPLPPLLDTMRTHLLAADKLLYSEPADPASGRGGWLDTNHDGKPDPADQLLIDVFKPGTQERVFDFSTAALAVGEQLPLAALTPTASLPPAKCAYRTFHIDDVATGSNVLATDGMSFSPDGTKIVFPLQTSGKSQLYTANVDGSSQSCITCGQGGNNDGVRWAATGDAMIFVSDRDHPYATGNAGGGFGQELYAMKPDGSQPTRLTTSNAWATNYHVNLSPDGMHVVWGSTESYAWDVMVADFVSDSSGMRLVNQRRIVHETAWWETHGFTPDNGTILTTSSHAAFQSTDLYAIDLATGTKKRLTNDPAWDEHGHLSPDTREISWISARWNPASVLRLNEPTISPAYDFLWVIPGIFFSFLNPPAGFTSELTLMDADGQNVHALTHDALVVADHEWSPDGTKIIFRQSSNTGQTTKIRVLTFDDCQ
jgi:Tol biopolymer transport system component